MTPADELDPADAEIVLATRERLAALGVHPRDVVLPGGSSTPPEGALHVVHASGWQVVSLDEGIRTELARTSDLAEACAFVVDRVSRPLPGPLPYVTTLTAEQEQAGRVLGPLAQQLAAAGGRPGVLTLPVGLMLDHWGALDGVVLFPAGTPLRERSLPPSVLEPDRPWHGLRFFGITGDLQVLARLTPARFAQPGGAVSFRIEAEGVTIRDLVLRGVLRPLELRKTQEDVAAAPRLG